MSRQHDEKAYRRKNDGREGALTPDFWSFHPTEAEKSAVDAFSADLDDPVQALAEVALRGITVTLSRARTNDSFCVILREQGASYGTGQALSVFHSSAARAITAALYVLNVKYPQWPTEPVRSAQARIDW